MAIKPTDRAPSNPESSPDAALRQDVENADGRPGLSAQDVPLYVATHPDISKQVATKLLGLHVEARGGSPPQPGGGGVSLRGIPNGAPRIATQSQTYQVGPAGVIGVVGDHPIPGVASYFYRVPIGRDAYVLVDSGYDFTGGEIRAMAGDVDDGGTNRPQAILLTHGHIDHGGGAQKNWRKADGLPVPIFVGGGDLPKIRDTHRWQRSDERLVMRAGQLLLPHARSAVDGIQKPVRDGDTVTIQGATFRALTVPGHSAGSVAWVWIEGGVAFVGDALGLTRNGKITPPPDMLNADSTTAQESLDKLLAELRSMGVSWVATGHQGFVNLDRPPLP